MNKVFKYIKQFFNKDFSFIYLLVVMVMLAILIYLNYWHGLERIYVSGWETRLSRFAGYYFLYLIPFAGAFLLQLLFFKNIVYFKKGWFWAILLLAPAFFSFRINFNFYEGWIINKWMGADQVFYLHCINWIVKVFVLLTPVYIIWLIKDKNTQPFYGTKALDSFYPYIIMLLLMVPLIAWASSQSDFLKVYPRAQMLNAISINYPVAKWKYVIFELCYGFDFVSIEFFFRGFLILALINICGKHAIIPAACFYCCIHFGKPMGEAISSFFGGILLGIITCNTGSIRGGLLVHLGTAWMMELGGWLGH